MHASWNRQYALDLAAASGHALVDLSLGVAADPPPAVALAEPHADGLVAYPLGVGTAELRAAGRDYLSRRFGVTVPISAVAACGGAKEFIATLPAMLRDLDVRPGRDTVLTPSLCYPPYGFGARLGGLRVHRVPTDSRLRMDVAALSSEVVSRALCLWVSSPANPTGVLEPLAELVSWGREHGVLVLCDEAYAETTWRRRPNSVLEHGMDGVLAVHSVSKRSNAPGLRVGFYAGDPELVAELVLRRRAAGLIASSASQAAAARLFAEDHHAEVQRDRARNRVTGLVELLNASGLACRHPDGGLFAWVCAPGGSGLDFAYRAARQIGLVVTPGIEYGPAGHGHVRIAAVREPADIAPRISLLTSFAGA